jgi:hypothetical protein
MAAAKKFLQTDKNKLSCILHSQKPRQLVLAAEERRYAAQESLANADR